MTGGITARLPTVKSWEAVLGTLGRMLTVDIGVLGQPAMPATVAREEIAQSGGAELTALVAAKDRGKALAVMADGLTAVLMKLQRDGLIDAVLGMGGGGGTAVACAAMRVAHWNSESHDLDYGGEQQGTGLRLIELITVQSSCL